MNAEAVPRRASTRKVFLRYLAFEAPSWVLLAAVLAILMRVWDLSLGLAALVLGLWIVKDLALFPIGDNYTMGPDDALRAVKLVRPKVVIPIHYNTFPLIAQDANAWAVRVAQETTTHAVVLKPGESYSL